jgi:hypothetical protein
LPHYKAAKYQEGIVRPLHEYSEPSVTLPERSGRSLESVSELGGRGLRRLSAHVKGGYHMPVQGGPSSLDQLVALGATPLPDQRESLRNSVRYWAERNGYAQADTERAA